MAESESVLLERFVRGGDSGAFAEIVRRYAGLVYATCMRVLADADRAADATQETFFQLMKKAGEIRGSLAGWLHRVAVRKAVDVMRNESARRRREGAYLDAKGNNDSTWRDVAPFVDEALDSLDEETRGLIVGHFLEGHSMTELAERSAVSRPTVSRHIDVGLARLRAQLRRQGVLVTAATLGSLLGESAAQSAPPALLRQLGKMSLLGAKAAGAGSAGGSSAALASGVVTAAKTKLMIAAASVVVIGVGLYTYQNLQSPPPSPPPPAVPADRATQRSRPRTDPAVAPLPSPRVEQPEEETSSETVAVQESPVVQDAAAPEVPAETPWWSTPAESPGVELDLSSPGATVGSLAEAMVAGDYESALACFSPESDEYDEAQRFFEATESDPDYEFKVLWKSVDLEAGIPIVSTTENPDGTVEVTWEVTFTVGDDTGDAGQTVQMDARLVPAGDTWLIDRL
jgi:RNA polymerase sigma factor (sigma-70 family)